MHVLIQFEETILPTIGILFLTPPLNLVRVPLYNLLKVVHLEVISDVYQRSNPFTLCQFLLTGVLN